MSSAVSSLRERPERVKMLEDNIVVICVISDYIEQRVVKTVDPGGVDAG